MIYPEIDTLRRASETFEKMAPDFHKHRNSAGIFVKGANLTKGIFDRIGPNETTVFGYEMKARQLWFLAGLVLLFSSSFIGTVIMWLTSIFDNAIYSQLIIANNTETFELWRRPPPSVFVKMYIFNYTNIDAYSERIDKKLNVQEVGPYVYEERTERVNIQFKGDDTVSYQEKKTYKFRPEMSQGHRQSDRVVVPNVPLLSGASHNRGAAYFTRLAYSTFLKTLGSKPFLTLPAQRFIFGYDDDLFAISKSVLKFQNKKLSEEFGLLANKIGVSNDVITVNTGALDINKVGMIETVNGKSMMNHWSTDECNSYRGTDGTTFPPKMIREKKQLHWFQPGMCRAMPMNFDKETTILNGKIPAYRYTMPYSVFDHPDLEPENQCFCDMNSGDCPYQGTFNSTPCVFGAPLFVSFPHFYKGADFLKQSITGLNPDPQKHETFVNIHPTMGFLMSGTTRMQGNIQMIKSYGISELDIFQQDELLLPISWMEMTLEDKNLPNDMISIIYQTTFTIKGVELGLKYGCLLTSIVTAVCIFLIAKSRYQSRERTSSIRPLQRRRDIES